MGQIQKVVAFLCMLCILFSIPLIAAGAEPPLSVSAASAVLMEASSGEIIYEKAAFERRSMASTTKIMTALVALENVDMKKIVLVSEKAVGIEGSSIYLYPNEKLCMEDLVYALLLESANDAATAIAVEVAGDVPSFAALMNQKAKELQLNDTHFSNPHGLDEESHYTTAYDLAKLAAYAIQKEEFRAIVSTYKKVIPLKEEEGSRLLLNHNKMLKFYDGAIGVKTGFTKKSGRCLVSAAERNGVRLIAVTLNAPDDWNDHKIMLDYGFEQYETILLTRAGDQAYLMPVVGGTVSMVQGRNPEKLTACVSKENQTITRTTQLKRFYYAPIAKGEEIGRVIYYNNGQVIGIAPILAEIAVPKVEYPQTVWEKILQFFLHKANKE